MRRHYSVVGARLGSADDDKNNPYIQGNVCITCGRARVLAIQIVAGVEEVCGISGS